MKNISSLEKIRSVDDLNVKEINSVKLFKGERYSYQIVILSEDIRFIKIDVESEISEYVTAYIVKDSVMDMAKYIVKRLLFMILTFLIIISVCFVLIRLLPNEPPQQFGKDMQLVLQSRYRQGIADINGNPIPLAKQYWNFLFNTLLRGNWGVSE